MHAPPPRPGPTTRRRSLVAPTLVSLFLFGPLACQNEPLDVEDPNALQTLLDDGQLDLTSVNAGALSAPPGNTGPTGAPVPSGPTMPPAMDAGVGSGGRSGSGGSSGSRTGGVSGSGGFAGMVGGTGGRGGGVVDAGSRPDVRSDGGPSPDGGDFDGGFPVFCPNVPFPLPPGSICPLQATGMWNFDNCNEFRSDINDDSFNGFTAFRSVKAACVSGIEGQGVALANGNDIVYVPDQPAFTFDSGVTVAGWFKPTDVTGVRTLFRKRDGLTSALALMIVQKHFVFVVGRERGLPAAVIAPAKADVFTHVAATYDGHTLRLYLNGEEVSTTRAPGRIEAGEGPLLFGNDGLKRRFDGTIDKLWFATGAASPETIEGLQCLRKAPSLVARPASSAPVPPGTSVNFELLLTSNSAPTCGSEDHQVFNDNFVEGFSVQPSFQFVQASPGQTVSVPVAITSSEDTEPGVTTFSFSAIPNNNFNDRVQTKLDFVTVAGTGCQVFSRRELMIRDVSVVDDPVRTTFNPASSDSRNGVWTFKHLMEALAPTPEQAPALAEAVFDSFTTPQTINGFRVEARPGLRPLVISQWPRNAGGQLDLAQAPMRLLAIVNRMDLRFLDNGNAGEGRLVFGILGPGGFPLEATVIFEYRLPAKTEDDVLAWASRWHALGSLPFPSEEYNAALQAITESFAGRGAEPERINGSALATFRTNEITFGGNGAWELREFTLDGDGRLSPATIKLTPDRSFDRTPLLGQWVNDNADAIRREVHDVPLTIQDGATVRPFLAGAVFNPLDTWFPAGVIDPEARHKFALNTCNGCHSGQETNTAFLMVFPRSPGQESRLSPFLTGTTVFDGFVGPRLLNDLARRNRDMRRLVCPPDERPPLDPIPPPVTDGGVLPTPDGGVMVPPRPPLPMVPTRPVPVGPPVVVTDASAGPVMPPSGAGTMPVSPPPPPKAAEAAVTNPPSLEELRNRAPFVEPDPPTTIRRGIGRVH
jgi:hypothetical protein